MIRQPASYFRRFGLFPVLAFLLALAGCSEDPVTKASNEQKTKDEATIKAYLAAQGLTTAQRTTSGVYYVVTQPGTGALPTAGQLITMQYRGYKLNGTADGDLFDSSYLTGIPFTFRVGGGRVVQGMDDAVRLLPKGTRARLIIPSGLGYGTTGTGDGSIGANQILIFYVTVAEIQ